MYYVYVLQSEKDKKLYIGFTANIEDRFKRHNYGDNISTKSRKPFLLIYYEAHLDKEDALRRERYFKTNKGKTTLKQILRNYFNPTFSENNE
jgi:putative endonuclease